MAVRVPLRSKPLALAALLACAAAPARAGTFGLQAVPAWSAAGELTVEIWNGSPLDVRIEQVVAALPNSTSKSCEWSSALPVDLAPDSKRVLVLAHAAALASCAQLAPLLADAGAQGVHFLRMGAAEAANLERLTAPFLTLEVQANHRQRWIRSWSAWLIAASRS